MTMEIKMKLNWMNWIADP